MALGAESWRRRELEHPAWREHRCWNDAITRLRRFKDINQQDSPSPSSTSPATSAGVRFSIPALAAVTSSHTLVMALLSCLGSEVVNGLGEFLGR